MQAKLYDHVIVVEIGTVLGVSVLAVVPLMQSEAERKQRFRRSLAMSCALGFVSVACLAVVAYTLVVR